MNTYKQFEDIPIGAKVELIVTDPIEGKLDIGFISQIEGYIDESAIQISAPIYEAKVYPVRVNSRIEAYVYRADHIYRVVGFVVDRLIENEIALLVIRVTDKIQRIQRRQFFRFDCSVPVTFYEQQKESSEKINKVMGRTIDLSGGGLSALTEKPLLKGSEVKGQLELDDDYLFDFSGKVIRCVSEVINEELKYISSLSFMDIGYKERERIIGYIFNQQRILLKKGLR